METPLPLSKTKPINPESPSPSTPSPTSSRLWRPAAQRNLRNQWSKMRSNKDLWISAASSGRSHATSLVNAYLSQRYLPARDLGVLNDMPGIREKAHKKLAQMQEASCIELISSYKEMVLATCYLVKACNSMRCFIKGSVASPLMHFSDHSANKNDPGDGGGVPVFSFLAISHFENLAQEIVDMFDLELYLKRLVVLGLLSICEEARGHTDMLNWSDELYPGENNDLRMHSLLSQDSCQPSSPRITGWESSNPLVMKYNHPSHKVLETYLTIWLSDPQIDMNRINSIFHMVEEEMHIKLS